MSYLLNNINLITLREETAYSNLISMGINNMRSFVTADLAFLLKPSPKIRINEIIKEEGLDQLSRPLIGVTVYRKIAQKAPNGYLDHIRIMANTIDRVIEDENSNVIFLPHSIGFSDKEDDRIVAKEIFEACKNKDHIKIIFTEYNPEELKGLLGYVDFLIGERLHSVINALSMCTPSIMLSYRGDIRLDIIRMIGQESAICYIDHLDPEDLLFKIKTMMSIRNKITEELKIQIPVIRERSRGNALKLKEILNPAKHS
jgi:polysaccharide pyruvyl transferase WcaK-like protein